MLASLSKTNTTMPDDSEFPLLGIEPKEIPTQVCTSKHMVKSIIVIAMELG